MWKINNRKKRPNDAQSGFALGKTSKIQKKVTMELDYVKVKVKGA